MWPITDPNIVRQMRGPEPHPLFAGELREYVRTEWNGDGGAVLGMIARATRGETARRRRSTARFLRRLANGIAALVSPVSPGRA